jgi:hypothetical protein
MPAQVKAHQRDSGANEGLGSWSVAGDMLAQAVHQRHGRNRSPLRFPSLQVELEAL